VFKIGGRMLRRIVGLIKVALWWDHGFESCSRNGWKYAFFYVVLTYIGRGFAVG
jgi:hypothetical protein